MTCGEYQANLRIRPNFTWTQDLVDPTIAEARRWHEGSASISARLCRKTDFSADRQRFSRQEVQESARSGLMPGGTTVRRCGFAASPRKSGKNAPDTTKTSNLKTRERTDYWARANELDLNARQKSLINLRLDVFEVKMTTSKWATLCKCSQDTAGRDIAGLMEAGLFVGGAEGARGMNSQADHRSLGFLSMVNSGFITR